MKNQTIYTATTLLILTMLIWSGLLMAKGPPVRVDQAIPGETIQGQQNLEVKLRGKGFGADATVRFLVTGTDNDKQISVKDVTYDEETGDLNMIISVIENATISGYDIEVQRSGRGGKGTDLFRVSSDSGGGHSNLSAKFCLAMTDLNPGFGSDGGIYCDSKRDRVGVATGSGPGFRFDTNNSKQAPRRTVRVEFPGSAGVVVVSDDFGNWLTTFPSMNYEIDLRFNRTYDGLDLGALNEEGGVGYVPIDVWLLSPEGTHSLAMAYGENIDPLNDHGYLKGNLCVANNTRDAKVTRISEVQWTIESNPDDANACLWDIDTDLRIQEGTVVNMPFHFTITIK